MAVIFSDGFETDDFSAWTATVGAVATVGAPVHHGSFAAEFQQGEYATQTLDEATVYARMYVRFSALPASTWQNNFFGRFRHTTGAAADLVYWGIRQAGAGTYGWVMQSLLPASQTDFSVAAISVDTWYCLELKYVNSAVAGEYRLYVDDVELLNRTGVDTSTGGGNAEIFYCGGWSTLAANLNVDCVVMDDANYIGVESAYSPSSRASLPSTMATMLNSKMLFSACKFPRFTPRCMP